MDSSIQDAHPLDCEGIHLTSGTRPYEGLIPHTPQSPAGILMLPPPSTPTAMGTMPAATAEALGGGGETGAVDENGGVPSEHAEAMCRT
jgi:hypothetical protein